ncbi:MAG: hypothetical protein F6K28_00975 [Microcoleus sp. SIO2G3]|nr:hypothetical protein [Microcoleus sp. SIO2G3]
MGLGAIAIEATELSQISITDLAAQVAAGEARAIALLEGWINHLNEIFRTEPTAANFERYLSLIKSEKIKSEKIKPENDAQLPNILADLHFEFFDCLKKLQQQETETAFRQFQQREQLNRQVVDSALSKLAAVLQPQQETVSFQQGTPLLVAAGAVGRAMGITISPPAQSNNLSQVQDPVEAIARSSQIRTRRVVLALLLLQY